MNSPTLMYLFLQVDVTFLCVNRSSCAIGFYRRQEGQRDIASMVQEGNKNKGKL
nr:MAG TPA: hypothetical protein [Bacteriophage sp.]